MNKLRNSLLSVIALSALALSGCASVSPVQVSPSQVSCPKLPAVPPELSKPYPVDLGKRMQGLLLESPTKATSAPGS